jgi:VWFA-related protein
MKGALRPLAVAAALAASTSAARSQQPVFRSTVDAVSVNVSVRKGNTPVPGLAAGDFELFDNNVRQTITVFSIEQLPIDVTLLLHVSRSIAGERLVWLKKSVVETAMRLKPDDRIRLVSVQHVFRELVPFQPGGRPPAVDGLTASGGTSLFDALTAAMMRASEPDRRQLIVAFTTGFDTISILNRETVQAVADRADTVVHIVVPVPAGGAARRTAVADAKPLSDLLARTGGQLFLTNVDAPIATAFKQALDEFRTSYVLRYVPTGVTRAGWHELAVKLKGGPYDVRHRKGYGG